MLGLLKGTIGRLEPNFAVHTEASAVKVRVQVLQNCSYVMTTMSLVY